MRNDTQIHIYVITCINYMLYKLPILDTYIVISTYQDFAELLCMTIHIVRFCRIAMYDNPYYIKVQPPFPSIGLPLN